MSGGMQDLNVSAYWSLRSHACAISLEMLACPVHVSECRMFSGSEIIESHHNINVKCMFCCLLSATVLYKKAQDRTELTEAGLEPTKPK